MKKKKVECPITLTIGLARRDAMELISRHYLSTIMYDRIEKKLKLNRNNF
jgi:hypothetical protein